MSFARLELPSPEHSLSDVMRLTAQHRFRTLEEARELSRILACFFPEPARAFHGLSELLFNAIEHGNLSIGFDEKTALLRQGKWHETIATRLELAPFAYRQASAELQIDEGSVSVVIRDEGEGFDWRPFMNFAPERLSIPNGRGIASARLFAFCHMEYRGEGNEVRVTQRRALAAVR
jgi:anti-sigma regulatory factor (Ser/Thr protein kinase)